MIVVLIMIENDLLRVLDLWDNLELMIEKLVDPFDPFILDSNRVELEPSDSQKIIFNDSEDYCQSFKGIGPAFKVNPDQLLVEVQDLVKSN